MYVINSFYIWMYTSDDLINSRRPGLNCLQAQRKAPFIIRRCKDNSASFTYICQCLQCASTHTSRIEKSNPKDLLHRIHLALQAQSRIKYPQVRLVAFECDNKIVFQTSWKSFEYVFWFLFGNKAYTQGNTNINKSMNGIYLVKDLWVYF